MVSIVRSSESWPDLPVPIDALADESRMEVYAELLSPWPAERRGPAGRTAQARMATASLAHPIDLLLTETAGSHRARMPMVCAWRRRLRFSRNIPTIESLTRSRLCASTSRRFVLTAARS